MIGTAGEPPLGGWARKNHNSDVNCVAKESPTLATRIQISQEPSRVPHGHHSERFIFRSD